MHIVFHKDQLGYIKLHLLIYYTSTFIILLKVIRFIAMFAVGVSDDITCTLSGVSSSGYTWIDENGNTVVRDRQIIISTNDSIHHKTYICYGFSLTTFTIRFLHIKFVINGKPNMHALLMITTSQASRSSKV